MMLPTLGTPVRFARRLGAALALACALPGCGTFEPAASAGATGPAPPAATAAAPAPAAGPAMGDFGPAIRCMDGLLGDYGVRDVSVLVEDLADPGRRLGAGTKEMLVAIVSDMTQRSRAIRLVASSREWGNTTSLLADATRREPLAIVPQYALRGSLFQQEAAQQVGVDLTLLSTQDMAVVPGMAARNTAQLPERGRAEIRKFGLAYTLAAADAIAALRPLVQFAAIEFVGRLAKVPYWRCLGASDANDAVATEMQDWYDALAAQPADLIGYFQAQLRIRRLYDGPLDGQANGPLKDAVARYRELLGLAPEPRLSLEFFRAYLAADHASLATRVAALRPAPAAGAATPVPAAIAATPVPVVAAAGPALALQIQPANPTRRYAGGEAVRFRVAPNRTAHVYCFLQDEDRRIVRFFPSRFQPDSRVTADGLELPGAMRFEITMNPRGTAETVACFATEQDVLAQLGDGLNGGDFAPLPADDLEQVRLAFGRAGGGVVAHEALSMLPR